MLFSNLPHSTAKKLIEKLKKLGNKRFKPQMRHVFNLSSFKRSDNEQIMSSIDVISDAISTHKKISFIYNNYDTDFKLQPRREEPYKVSPFQMVTANCRYYLIANTDGHDNISHYRMNQDGRILVEVNVNEHAIKYWVMQFGEFVEVVTPVTLREEIYKTAEKIMDAHH